MKSRRAGEDEWTDAEGGASSGGRSAGLWGGDARDGADVGCYAATLLMVRMFWREVPLPRRRWRRWSRFGLRISTGCLR